MATHVSIWLPLTTIQKRPIRQDYLLLNVVINEYSGWRLTTLATGLWDESLVTIISAEHFVFNKNR